MTHIYIFVIKKKYISRVKFSEYYTVQMTLTAKWRRNKFIYTLTPSLKCFIHFHIIINYCPSIVNRQVDNVSGLSSIDLNRRWSRIIIQYYIRDILILSTFHAGKIHRHQRSDAALDQLSVKGLELWHEGIEPWLLLFQLFIHRIHFGQKGGSLVFEGGHLQLQTAQFSVGRVDFLSQVFDWDFMKKRFQRFIDNFMTLLSFSVLFSSFHFCL